ncbi:unnamed protein product [Notodromas monacha]|uniref:DNA primase large subunit n=1 Tax=Notodromas monacha TaxID=399045 RepID=A0A7R9GAR5_9CRUS|nr:unnamed protein product [Notodromas monacha]CAG0915717.1 unnamed protein product [Notodromas monacha]
MEILNPRMSRISRKRNFHLSVQQAGLEKLFPAPVSMFEDPPSDIISLQCLDELAIERLQLLRSVERAGTMPDWEKSIVAEISKVENLRPYLKLESSNTPEAMEAALEARKRDYLSHFVLRLAYCRSETLRRWFVTQEADLFRYRLTRISADEKKAFIRRCGLKFSESVAEKMTSGRLFHVTVAEKKERLQCLAEGTSALYGSGNLYSTVEKTVFYKVPFYEALELVRSRKAYLEGGMAYVADQDLNSIILQTFKSRLNRALALLSHMLPTLEKDERLKPLVCNFHNSYIGPEYERGRQGSGRISLENLHVVAEESFPLCMKHLYDILKTQHHLKHFSRIQLNLFFKGIGLSLEDSLQLFRTEFAKGKTEPEKFEKKYAYSFRHGYGKEGKRADYRPFSCMKIIQQHPGAQETHGCPFAHFDVTSLRAKLKALKISEPAIQDVLDTKRENHHQIACGKVFQYTHNLPSNSVGINHPNQYFEASQEVRHGKQDQFGIVSAAAVKEVKEESSVSIQDDWNSEMEFDESALKELGV